ncbi:acyltransferase [Pantoea phage AH07]|nr:acyltransferase [Pantoea phage AH07]
MNPRHYDFIDSLRGIAALSVLIVHLGRLTTPSIEAPAWIFPLTDIGGTGVLLFFVLSAFTLSLSMKSRKDEANPLRNYFIRRFFRIAPLFYVVMIATYFRDIYVFGVWQPWSEVLKSMFFVLNFFPGSEQGFVWASWTIGAEMAFYAIFPIIFKLSKNLRSSLLILLASFFLRWFWQLFIFNKMGDTPEASAFYSISIIHHLPHFIMGIVTYHVYEVTKHKSLNRIACFAFLVALPALIFTLLAYKVISYNILGDRSTSCSLLFSIIIIGVSKVKLKAVVNKFTIYVGKVSYSVYLIHANVIYFAGSYISSLLDGYTYSGWKYILCLVCVLSITLALSALSYKIIERNGNKLGRNLIGWLNQKEMNSQKC